MNEMTLCQHFKGITFEYIEVMQGTKAFINSLI